MLQLIHRLFTTRLEPNMLQLRTSMQLQRERVARRDTDPRGVFDRKVTSPFDPPVGAHAHTPATDGLST